MRLWIGQAEEWNWKCGWLPINSIRMKHHWLTGLLCAWMLPLAYPVPITAQSQTTGFPVVIQVNALDRVAPWNPAWRFFGADEPNYATTQNGSALLRELGALAPGNVYFRTHNLLNTGNGLPALKWGSTDAYHEGSNGQAVYDWTLLDGIFDQYQKSGIQPYVEIGFMPQALSIHPNPYQHHWTPHSSYSSIYTGWAYPPREYPRWSELVYQWTRHDLDRFGSTNLSHWYWETWNEPNIGYWQGKRGDFFKLHDYAIQGVLRAFPGARVGGPDSAGGGTPFLRDFLKHCLYGTNAATGRIGTPLDFISFHAKGSPVYTNDHVRMGISSQLRNMDSAFKIIASFPALTHTPVVIGESDPDGCAACQSDALGYRNGSLYACYTAATLAREYELADRDGICLEGSLTWAFEFEDTPPFAGFRVLTTDGIDLPVLNVFRMLARMGGDRVKATSTSQIPLNEILRHGVRMQPDVSALASLDHGQLCVLVWHYLDDDLPGPPADVTLHLHGLPAACPVTMRHFRIDENHSNSFTAWKAMNSPYPLSPSQTESLHAASQLAEVEPAKIIVSNKSDYTAQFQLPREAVSLLVFSWNDSAQPALQTPQ